MRAWALPLAAGAVLALAALIGVNLLRPAPTPSRAEIAHRLATELRCPDCQGLSVADSSSQSAAEIRSQITRLLGQGMAPEEVRQYFVTRYGPWILLAPEATIAWVLPFLVLLAGGAGLAAWVWHGRRRSAGMTASAARGAGAATGAELAAVDAGRLAQVRDEVESLDA
jgi:cytochrome c-type biogenesis protein CcmH